ncbi:hypothetical protein QYF50_07070 [Paenibacillus vini]|uniref:hypothetical protein n=1 Tax=Paenibacillus vini TaxID=1476024 RepID=UPI0025B6A410|nr:hypothetical protein [Paenibacillus vini]MDN4067653.1 hypothetical protein [Paenibacillus vini]
MKSGNIFKERPIKLNDSVLINAMEKIVKQVVANEKFHLDFYRNDLKEMETCRIFAWYVYDCGTHFIPLNDLDAVRSFQKEWLSTMSELKEKKKPKEPNRLYVCNADKGELKRVLGFEEGNFLEHLQAV